MSEQKQGTLNWLDRHLPAGLVVDAAWLAEHGYYASLLHKYVASGWLEKPAHRVYRRPGGKLTWEQVVISLQTLLHAPLTVGGRTALGLEGFAHYLPHDLREVHLYGPTPPPRWLDKLPVGVHFIHHNDKRLFRNEPVTRGLGSLSVNLSTRERTSTDPLHGAFSVQHWGHAEWPLVISTPERAILELLDELPAHETFHQVDKLMEGLSSLSPRRLQKLLLDCRNVKVKRLFFFFADRHQHAWLKHLNKSAVDLGKGKRMLVPGGRLDPTYQITVPGDLNAV